MVSLQSVIDSDYCSSVSHEVTVAIQTVTLDDDDEENEASMIVERTTIESDGEDEQEDEEAFDEDEEAEDGDSSRHILVDSFDEEPVRRTVVSAYSWTLSQAIEAGWERGCSCAAIDCSMICK